MAEHQYFKLLKELEALRSNNAELRRRLELFERNQALQETLERLERVLDDAPHMEGALDEAMGVVLEVMGVDRAWLLYPCRPGVEFFDLPAERCNPHYPGARAMGIGRIPAAEDSHILTPLVLESKGPIVFHPTAGHRLPQASLNFGVRSEMELVLRPKEGEPWVLGVHQCSRARLWTRGEQAFFMQIGRVLTRKLTEFLRAKRVDSASDDGHQRQRLESLGVLAGGVAHDFNNLLGSILGNAELALQDSRTQSVSEALSNIVSASRRAGELCRQLLAYAGQGQVARLPLDLNVLIQDMVKLLKVSSRQVSLRLKLDRRPVRVDADEAQLQQVIMNLVLNAVESFADGVGKITIRTSVRFMSEEELGAGLLDHVLPAGHYVRLTILDNGCGMDAEMQKRIFEPFFSTKFTGRGLGLSAVLGIVASHQGNLELESAVAMGTRFTIVLPISDSAPVERITPERLQTPRPQANPSRPVLIADDEPQLLRLYRRILRRAGYTVITAPNGREAARYFTNQPQGSFAAVVLDMTMPVMGGAEALALMREHQHDIRAIFVSGYNEQELYGELSNPGTAAFLAKPFSPDDLLRVLARLTADLD